MRRFLKAATSLSLAAMMALGLVIVGEVNDVRADTGYDKIAPGATIVNAPWKFANGVNATGAFELSPNNTDVGNSIKDASDVQVGWKYLIKKTGGFKWPGNTNAYDLYVEMSYYPKNPTTASSLTGANTELTGGNVSVGSDYLNFKPNGASDYSLDLVFWATETNSTVDDFSNKDSISTNVPFVVGPVYFGSGERYDIYSETTDTKIYTNLKNPDPDGPALLAHYSAGEHGNHYDGYGNPDGKFDKPDTYMVGLGRDSSGKAKIRYYNTGGGTLEVRLGYQSYTVKYIAGDVNVTGVPTDETVPAKNGATYHHPKVDPTGVTTNTNYSVSKYVITKIYTGDNAGNANTIDDVENGEITSNGIKFKVGSVITPEQIKLIDMEYNVEIAVYSQDDSKFKLTYHNNNDKLSIGDVLNIENNIASGDIKADSSGYSFGVTEKTGSDGTYIFRGWYTSQTTQDNSTKYDFSNPITADTDIYAKWEKKVTPPPTGGIYTPPAVEHKVEFETPIGPKPDTQTGIKNGETATDPITTIKPGFTTPEGFTFEGWYIDKELTIPYDFSKPIDKDIILFAKWQSPKNETLDPEKPVVKVEFETEIGVPPTTQVEVPGNTAEDPGAPMDLSTLKPGTVINGYRFDGWFLDKDYTIKYNFDTPLTEDIVLYAKWTALGVLKSPKTGEPISPMAGGIIISLACVALLGISLIRKSGKRRREDI